MMNSLTPRVECVDEIRGGKHALLNPNSNHLHNQLITLYLHPHPHPHPHPHVERIVEHAVDLHEQRNTDESNLDAEMLCDSLVVQSTNQHPHD